MGQSPVRPCLARGDCCPPGEGCNRAGTSSRDGEQVLQPILHRTQKERWVTANPRSARFEPLPFRMLTQKRILRCVRPQDWFAAIDLKDAYFHVSILSRHRQFLRFAFKGRAWQYKVLPFGLSLSPRVFTKLTEGALAPLRLAGIRILNYLDVWLILAHSQEQLTAHRDEVLRHPPIGVAGQLEKEQTRPGAEDLFSRDGAGLGHHSSMPLWRARSPVAELSEGARQQNSGPTEILSEAPGAYGIRCCCHAARTAPYETTSALASRLSSKTRMACGRTPSLCYCAVSPHPQPLERPLVPAGRCASGTGVQSCCCLNRCFQHGLGSRVSRACSCGPVGRCPAALAYNRLELLAVFLAPHRFSPRKSTAWGVCALACLSSPAVCSSGVTHG
ncbi:uncharacterized protein [Danio rerio]|uniref:Uncharacterized protein n=1 Tax=Danio rerio TaxID=7955 RepID=A0AC58GGZ4_DANRE